jgi:hypothetical protein
VNLEKAADRPPERRSRVGAKDQNQRAVADQLEQLYFKPRIE